MKINFLKNFVISSLLVLVFMGNVYAANYTFTANSTTFASLSVNLVSGNNYSYSLSFLNNAGGTFNSSSYIRLLGVDNANDRDGSNPNSVSGPAAFESGNNAVDEGSSFNGYAFDFVLSNSTNNGGANRLKVGETLSWNSSFGNNNPGVFTNFQLRVNTGFDAGSYVGALQSVQAVPEADTSAMLLVGLGLLGFVARRRQSA